MRVAAIMWFYTTKKLPENCLNVPTRVDIGKCLLASVLCGDLAKSFCMVFVS
jgi:hypothetical protein